jgi:hypothetical protein
MNDFERDLREALSRREPPPGFTERVMARIPDRRRAWWRFPVFRWVPALAMLLVIVSVAGIVQEHREQQRREQAKQELMLAIEVTARSIQTTKVKLLNTGGGSI